MTPLEICYIRGGLPREVAFLRIKVHAAAYQLFTPAPQFELVEIEQPRKLLIGTMPEPHLICFSKAPVTPSQVTVNPVFKVTYDEDRYEAKLAYTRLWKHLSSDLQGRSQGQWIYFYWYEWVLV